MKRYRVSGTQRVAGHEPGDEFTASYSEEHELYLLTGGHLQLVKAKPHRGSAKHADGQDDGGDEPAASPQTTTEDQSS